MKGKQHREEQQDHGELTHPMPRNRLRITEIAEYLVARFPHHLQGRAHEEVFRLGILLRDQKEAQWRPSIAAQEDGRKLLLTGDKG